MKNKKGFTLIELLAVIVILGLLIAIAIPSITKYITQSRKKTLATTISKYIDAGMVSVNNGEYMLNICLMLVMLFMPYQSNVSRWKEEEAILFENGIK